MCLFLLIKIIMLLEDVDFDVDYVDFEDVVK